MKNKNYYYLITALPELRLDDYKEPYRVKDFVEQLKDQLIPEHYVYIKDVMSLYDNSHIIDAVLKSEVPWAMQAGNWTYKQIKKNIVNDEFEFDGYVMSFLEQIKQREKDDEVLRRSQLENMLFTNFYKKMTKHENDFIRNYFKFDLTLKNIIAGLNKRNFKLSEVDFISVEEDSYINEQLAKSNSSDFGLSRDIEYLQKLIEHLSDNDSVHSEKYIEQLRFEKIEEINTFKYFEIDVLLGYLLKLMSVERWIGLEEHKGDEIFQSRTDVKINSEVTL